ncbi:MarR family transcriptional regulator [Halosimplex rubrum]|uniref:MarR family transcriptional regulator n=1 Tax=Halosimplex rubrum TaxID=869889 RepID=A0A7D5P1F7_9EURY|nr:helix-turn-helix domain-containing protein [Halosimplex rubrum]QLH78297.1 MarR family transcriptional regulator [Halosimplex rubrum]
MGTDRVSATATSVTILESLRRQGTAGVTAIAEDIDGSKANVHKHLATLEDAGFVRSADGQYELGHRFLGFAVASKRQEPAYIEGVSNLAKLADVTGATATLVVREGLEAVYLHTVVPVGRVDTDSLEGRRGPLTSVPGGLAILSCYPPERRRALVEETVDDTDRVEPLLDRLRTAAQESAVVEPAESHDGPDEIVAPIAGPDGDPAGAVGVERPTTSDESDRVEADLRKLVRNTAGAISNRLSLTR